MTIKDVAARAGVSIATVSRVLNDRGPVGEATRAAVYRAMKELDYRPNEVARSLGRQHTQVLGLSVPSIAHPFYSKLAESIERYARELGFRVMLFGSPSDACAPGDTLELIRGSLVDGVILASHQGPGEQFSLTGLPVVSVETVLSEKIPAVLSDDYQGGCLAARHLISKGCRKLAHISGDLPRDLYADRRCAAFCDVCRDKGVEYHVYQATERMLQQMDYAPLVHRLLHELSDADGIFASSDIIAAEVIKACGELGRPIPEKMKVTGFDDIPLAAMLYPALSTVRQDVDGMARAAVDAVISLILKKPVAPRLVLPVTLVERGTT